MLKPTNFMRVWTKHGRKIILSITPPIIIISIKNILNRLFHYNAQFVSSAMYSTIDNPLEVPQQVEAYLFCRDKYLMPRDTVLDVGLGLGYGLNILGAKAENLTGVDVDEKAVIRAQRIFKGHPRVKAIMLYDGKHLPFADKTFDVVTCIDVIEHVEEYKKFLLEMIRVSRRLVFISTPNQRPENTLPNGKPKNYWHLREWTKNELDIIFKEIGFTCEWNFLNGNFEGPFTVATIVKDNTFSLIPVIKVTYKEKP